MTCALPAESGPEQRQTAHLCDVDSPPHSLPVELYDRIIDFVAADPTRGHALQACALACRSWLPRCRFHLFYSVQVTSFSGYDRLDEVLRSNPGLATYIHVLNFEIGIFGVSLLDHSRDLPLSLLTRLPFLHSVKYYSALTAQTPSLRAQIAKLPHINTVNTFSINVCVFQKFSDMIMLLACFPSLKSLRLNEVFFLDRNYRSCIADARYGCPLPLVHLHIESLHEAPAIFGWLVETESISTISTLSVGLDRCEHLKDLDDFLHVCGESIKHISFRSRSMLDNKYRCLNLDSNTNLHSLTFRILFLSDIQALPSLLSTVRSDFLTKITIRLFSRSGTPSVKEVLRDLEPVDCSSLDDLLTSPQFASLRSVVIDFACAIHAVEIRPLLMRHMPRLHARGHIVVHREIA